jgi:hypothetical protein
VGFYHHVSLIGEIGKQAVPRQVPVVQNSHEPPGFRRACLRELC